jgi:signal transduction histidine kinase
MKSIRRTLLLNVLLLLVATLGAVSYFVYSAAEGALRARQKTARELAEVRFDDRRDEELRNRADELATEVQSNWNRDKFREQWMASQVAAIMPSIGPSAHVLQTVQSISFFPGPVGFEINVLRSTELRLNEDELYRESMLAAHEYVQVTGEKGGLWQSRTLVNRDHVLDDKPIRQSSDFQAAQFDTLELSDGTTVRRVIVKAPVTRFAREGSIWLPRRRTEDAPHPSRAVIGLAGAARSPERRSPPITPPPGPVPNFYLQCAWDASPENPRLAPLIAEREKQLTDIDARTEDAVASLRSTLAWTVSGAVAATLLLGWFLVGVGLVPLKRLSVAVSEISPKDFRLPIDPATMPSEVHPVVDRLSQALQQLQAAFEREKRAGADISHELRTPLAALTTTLDVACRKERTPEQYRRSLEDCRGIARQMSHLVERMLMLAWLDAGADQIRNEQVEVGDLVSGVAAIGKPLAEAHGLSFRLNMVAPVTVRTDPDKVREVVMNLIHNAIEYNRPGGEVELTAAPMEKGVILEVRDTGIGMAPEIQEKIFERFFRADPSRQATGVHAGLGLAIVKEYVDRLGGRLTVDSVVGRGSRFRIELPNAS